MVVTAGSQRLIYANFSKWFSKWLSSLFSRIFGPAVPLVITLLTFSFNVANNMNRRLGSANLYSGDTECHLFVWSVKTCCSYCDCSEAEAGIINEIKASG